MNLSQNYFELYQLPGTYAIDLNLLAQRHRVLQQQVHPDRFAHTTGVDRRAAMQMATLANDAYRTLRDPLLRAEYLLSLHGVAHCASDTISDPEFLMEQMELREQLDELRVQSDIKTLETLMRKIDWHIEQFQSQLAELFECGDDESIRQARFTVLKYSFFRRLQHEAQALEDDLTL